MHMDVLLNPSWLLKLTIEALEQGLKYVQCYLEPLEDTRTPPFYIQ